MKPGLRGLGLSYFGLAGLKAGRLSVGRPGRLRTLPPILANYTPKHE